MEKVNICAIAYGARACCGIETLLRSSNYRPILFIIDKQLNPFNLKVAKEHTVISDLNLNDICRWIKKRKLDFVFPFPEAPIIDGIKDKIEKEMGIPVICPTQEFALEGSKVKQRKLLEKVLPQANPRFKIFDSKTYKSLSEVKKDLWLWLDKLKNKVAVKPDKPGFGKGVGVWGDHFNSRAELLDHFLSIYQAGDKVIVEEKLAGEESSFQAFCDGKHLIFLPETRDYKRRFENDAGPNTGGMGSYKDKGYFLPFMSKASFEKEIEIVNKIFKEIKGNRNCEPGLIGIPFYVAFMHTATGPKILEINSRLGDPESQNILPILESDFVDLCYKIIEGNLKKVEVAKKATVVIYKVPKIYPEKDEKVRKVNLTQAYKLKEKYKDKIRIYPASMNLKENETYAGTSRTVCMVGIADSIKEAREISLEGIKAIKGDLDYRKDIASTKHINRSIEHMKKLSQ